MDTCLVVVNSNNFIYPFLKKDLCVYDYYKKTFSRKWANRFIKVFYKIAEIFHMYRLCYGPWYSELISHKKRFIFFDECGLTKALLRIVNKHSDFCSFYLWNPSARVVNHNLFKKLKISIFSFDLADCDKYGYKYKPSIVPDFYLNKIGEKNEYDLVFIGLDKGRRAVIEKIKEMCSEFNTHIVIIDESRVGTIYPVTYDVNIDYVAKSKVNIEWLQSNQHGETMRTVESIMMKKKMITNNTMLKKQPYYNSNNFLVVDNIDNLKKDEIISFIKSDYADDRTIDFSDRYPKKWADSFFKN